MEIERKFLISSLPEHLSEYPRYQLEQAYISTKPVIRVRKKTVLSPSASSGDTQYILTVKSGGMLVRQEFEMPLEREEYESLLSKKESNTISKCRHLIPLENSLTLELDLFSGAFEGLIMGEIEFESEEAAKKYNPPAWIGKEVTFDKRFHNSTLSAMSASEISDLMIWIHQQN